MFYFTETEPLPKWKKSQINREACLVQATPLTVYYLLPELAFFPQGIVGGISEIRCLKPVNRIKATSPFAHRKTAKVYTAQLCSCIHYILYI